MCIKQILLLALFAVSASYLTIIEAQDFALMHSECKIHSDCESIEECCVNEVCVTGHIRTKTECFCGGLHCPIEQTCKYLPLKTGDQHFYVYDCHLIPRNKLI